MMHLAFTKMAGTGNDFIVIDNCNSRFNGDDSTLIARLCSRRTGIGADGLILAHRSATRGAEVRMIYYNADGRRASMCGNGARCTAAFAHAQGWVTVDRFNLASDQGVHPVAVEGNRIALTMTTPTLLHPHPGVLEESRWTEGGFINTGVPHYVIFADEIERIDVNAVAPVYRQHPAFPEGANVNFAARTDQGLSVRTFERGVEAETLSCGTGCVAAALLAGCAGLARSPVAIETRGGTLEVRFDENWSHVVLAGPAEIVYTGEIEIV